MSSKSSKSVPTKEQLFIHNPSLLVFPMHDINPLDHDYATYARINAAARLIAFSSLSAGVYFKNWKYSAIGPILFAIFVFLTRHWYTPTGQEPSAVKAVARPAVFNPTPFSDVKGAEADAFKSRSLQMATTEADRAFGNTNRPAIYTVRDFRSSHGVHALAKPTHLDRVVEGLDEAPRHQRSSRLRPQKRA